MGDFNAPHTAWAYPNTTKKGARVHDTAQQHRLTLWNDPLQATRVGNSVSRDTNPDLTFTANVHWAEWSRLSETLGSDHHIIQLDIAHNRKPTKTGVARLTDWKSFRDNLSGNTTIDDIDHWLKGLLITAENHTKNIQLSTNTPAVDPHLLHHWEAKRSLLKRWKRQKLNRKLKQRIALLTIQDQDYAEQFTRQNWRTFCDRIQGTLSTKKTWHLLRALLATDRTKTQQRQDLRRLIHNHAGSEHDLLRELQQKLSSNKPTSSASGKTYDGAPNPDLDRPFTQAELHAALAKLTRNTSPGKDRITNKLLRNLPQYATTALLQYYNDCWEKGDLPAAWKHSEVTMIPKPNKPLLIENLRPISLTSCVGKLLEHMDVLLLLKEDLLDYLDHRRKSSILAIDVKGAFDNVSHEAILRNLEDTGCGTRIYNYISSFLTHRTATCPDTQQTRRAHPLLMIPGRLDEPNPMADTALEICDAYQVARKIAAVPDRQQEDDQKLEDHLDVSHQDGGTLNITG
ncbi:uncharacterized protein [Dermacentor andersoni]|uniref:uncharacterized protein n=1 Tax=Dermacentor andersoni TaxID=34620 RepID=UPI003B3A727E